MMMWVLRVWWRYRLAAECNRCSPKGGREVKLGDDFSGALRTFAYFLASGRHHMLDGVDYLPVWGAEPSAIEMVFAIFANVVELDENGRVLNFEHAQKRATDYLRQYCDQTFEVNPPFEDWEIALHDMPPPAR